MKTKTLKENKRNKFTLQGRPPKYVQALRSGNVVKCDMIIHRWAERVLERDEITNDDARLAMQLTLKDMQISANKQETDQKIDFFRSLIGDAARDVETIEATPRGKLYNDVATKIYTPREACSETQAARGVL